ncbi:MAG: proteasome accessory factor PafA2 [Streptosporangiales bacterium]|nr:proteasome accessory factor PafA2 [Streptosporangiales bacterium]
MGTETEYGITVTGGPGFDAGVVSSLVVQGCAGQRGRLGVRWGSDGTYRPGEGVGDPGFTEDGIHEPPPDVFVSDVPLRNGARFYVDHAHPEYATPECAGPYDAMLWDKAGERIVEAAAEVAAQALRERGAAEPGGQREQLRVLATKNNTDGKGASYGTHENYLVDRAVPFDELARQLIPFLVSRQVMVGAGRVGGEHGGAVYQLSQRSEFFEAEVGAETRRKRPIINTRDEPHADPARFRRFHVIVGDANMSEVCTYLKLGSCALVLMMAEDGFLPDPPSLAQPVAALHQISRDLSCSCPLPLAGGGMATAVQLQWHYLAHAERYLRGRGEPAWGPGVVSTWERVLAALERDPMSLAGAVDWVTKHALLARYVERNGLAWNDDRVKLLDVLYHDVSRTQGGYHRLAARGGVQTMLAEEDVREAMERPPPGTRARFRDSCLARYVDDIAQVDWSVLTFGSPTGGTGSAGSAGTTYRVQLPTPGPIAGPGVEILERSATAEDFVAALRAADLPDVQVR